MEFQKPFPICNQEGRILNQLQNPFNLSSYQSYSMSNECGMNTGAEVTGQNTIGTPCTMTSPGTMSPVVSSVVSNMQNVLLSDKFNTMIDKTSTTQYATSMHQKTMMTQMSPETPSHNRSSEPLLSALTAIETSNIDQILRNKAFESLAPKNEQLGKLKFFAIDQTVFLNQ